MPLGSSDHWSCGYACSFGKSDGSLLQIKLVFSTCGYSCFSPGFEKKEGFPPCLVPYYLFFKKNNNKPTTTTVSTLELVLLIGVVEARKSRNSLAQFLDVPYDFIGGGG